MRTREERRMTLHLILTSIFDNVYFQPPPTIEMKYPCVRYSITRDSSKMASNIKYTFTTKFEVITISKDPTEPLVDDLMVIDGLIHQRTYIAENLYHNVFSISIN